ncbi:MAG: CoA transferase [Chloroflexi bacterium]|nr:CoA transferase [Chloroflexota bacterium]
MVPRLNPDLPLSPYRVLDLTDEKGLLCGRMLGDLGADVIQVEPPDGNPARKFGPFYADKPGPDGSLYWWAFSNNKRSITLNLESRQGRDILQSLVKTADFVIESFAPGHMDSLGIGYAALSGINPGLIMTSITPFGQTGPYSRHAASDMVCMAMGGHMFMTGDPDRPPVRIGFPQAYLLGASAAAAASLVALWHKETAGEGQHIDVSIQEAVVLCMLGARPAWDANKVIWRRAGNLRVGFSLASGQQMMWPCQDGYVTFLVFGGMTGAQTNKALVEWMSGEGMADDFLKSIDWASLDMARTTEEFHRRIEALIGRFFLAKTKRELYDGAIRRGIMLCPVASVQDILEDRQLAARGFWQKVEHPELGTGITYPGAFARLSETPIEIRRRPPLVGENNEEVYVGEMGISRENLVILRESGAL